MEKKTVYRWWFVWNFEKEEQWLNSMALEGWILDQIGFCKYTFVKGIPGDYIIRLEMHNGDKGYMSFMEDLGAEYIGRYMQWVYFKRKSSFGEFNLFSDIDSKIEHLNKISKTLKVVGFANILIGLANTFNPANIGFLNLLCACLLMYALGRIHGKTDALQNERILHE